MVFTLLNTITGLKYLQQNINNLIKTLLKKRQQCTLIKLNTTTGNSMN